MIGISDIVNNAKVKAGMAHENRVTGSAGIDSTAHSRNNFQRVLDNELTAAGRPGKEKKIDKKLMDVCNEMESLFVAKMFKEMRKTVHKNQWIHGGFAEEIFEDMLYDEYSLNLSKNSNLGLAKMLYEEMSRKM